MANPNLVNVTTITGNTTYLTPSSSVSPFVLLPNAASSNQVLKINQIVATNANTSAAANATVSIYTNGGVAQGSAPSGGTAFPIASTISVPVGAALIVVDKSTQIYLSENTSIVVTTSISNALTFTVSYEAIS
jgi:hypothetical protein